MRLPSAGMIRLLLAFLALAPVPSTADDLPSWTVIGPDGGDVRTLATSPALPDWIFAGLQGKGYGIFSTSDRGRSWGAAPDQLGQLVFDLTVNADGTAVYAATAGGLLRSTDGGAFWPALDTSPEPDDYTLVQAHPRRPEIVFAVRGGVLFRSADRGVTRQAVAGPEGVLTLAFSSAARPTAYAGAGNGLWKSADTGRTWTSVDLGIGFTPGVHSIALDPRNPRVLYVGLEQHGRVLLKSTDGGATWRVSQRGLPRLSFTSPRVSDLAVDRTDSSVVYAIVGGELFRSLNAGQTWSRPVSRLPGGTVADLETTGYGLLAATPAGVLLSVDRGLTWRIRTRSMTATSITGLAIDRLEPPELYAGDTRAGIFKTASRNRPWLRLGDPAEPFAWFRPLQVDPIDRQTVYAGSTGEVAKSTDGGRSWTLHGGLTCNAVKELFLDPREPSRLYASGEFVTAACGLTPTACTFFRSLDAGESWECIPLGVPPHARFQPLGVEPFASVVYAQSFNRDLWQSTDAGTTWSLLAEGLIATSFAASPRVEGTLWAGKAGAVARSRDGGKSWQSFSTGLPSGQIIVELAPDRANSETLYAATIHSGVFKSTDAGETWSLAGLWPQVPFQGGLLVDPGVPEIVYAGTDGLGVLRLDQRGN
jgi:photosystem II stability/assembly factor-like uncharacterized protein